MAREFAKDFYNSIQWRECRESYARSKGYLCERCMERGIYRAGEIVHHKIHLTPENINDPSITLSFDNLKLVCRDCHAVEHKPEKRYKFDELGKLVTLDA